MVAELRMMCRVAELERFLSCNSAPFANTFYDSQNLFGADLNFPKIVCPWCSSSRSKPMNKPLTAVEVSHATSPVTKRQKLMRFAYIVRSSARCALYLFNNIEYLDRGQWKYISHPASAFALAAQDKVLRGAGLEDSSVADAQRFFDLSREELAEFSCVCGGSINNNKMAERIERIAPAAPHEHMRRRSGGFKGDRTSAAIWSRCAPPRLRRAIHLDDVVAGRAVGNERGRHWPGPGDRRGWLVLHESGTFVRFTQATPYGNAPCTASRCLIMFARTASAVSLVTTKPTLHIT
jgi:hypothetical protein